MALQNTSKLQSRLARYVTICACEAGLPIRAWPASIRRLAHGLGRVTASTVIAAVALSVPVTWAKEESQERVDGPRERAAEINLRVVRYVLQSQAPAVDTVTSPPLYDFTYRLVIANDGASLSGARGLLTSRLANVLVLSDAVDLGPIAAGVQVSPTVTVTLRAATAPDLAVLAGGRSARRDSRDQEADREGRATRKETPLNDEERKAPLAWHWTALPGHAGPVVELLTPQ